MCAKLLQLCLTLCNPRDRSLPVCSVHGIFQARTLKRVAVSSSRGSSRPRDQPPSSLMSPALAGGFFTTSAVSTMMIYTKIIMLYTLKNRAPSLHQPIHRVCYGLDFCVPRHPHLKFICSGPIVISSQGRRP